MFHRNTKHQPTNQPKQPATTTTTKNPKPKENREVGEELPGKGRGSDGEGKEGGQERMEEKTSVTRACKHSRETFRFLGARELTAMAEEPVLAHFSLILVTLHSV